MAPDDGARGVDDDTRTDGEQRHLAVGCGLRPHHERDEEHERAEHLGCSGAS
jgi:hypothetical protein